LSLALARRWKYSPGRKRRDC